MLPNRCPGPPPFGSAVHQHKIVLIAQDLADDLEERPANQDMYFDSHASMPSRCHQGTQLPQAGSRDGLLKFGLPRDRQPRSVRIRQDVDYA